MQDALLLRRYVREQSQAAFAEIVQRYRRLVYFTCLREVGDAQMAEDATQSVFLILARKAPSLNPKPSLAGWLFQTARLSARDALKREQRRRLRELRAAQTVEEAALMPEEGTPEQGVLNETLAALKHIEREAVLLRFFEELNFKEIGAALGVSEDTAQKRVSRALDKLRMQFARHGFTLTVAALIGILMAEGSRAEPLPPPDVDVLKASKTGSTSGGNAQQIAEGVLQTMWMTKAGLTVGAISLGLVGIGVGTTVLKGSAAPSPRQAAGAVERPLLAKDRTGPLTIQEIRITGNRYASTQEIMGRVRSKPGDVLDDRKIMDDVRAIYDLGSFDLVGPFDYSTVGGGKVIVTIPVTEVLKTIPVAPAPLYFEDIRITGNYRVATSDIMKRIHIKPGDVADKQGKQKLNQEIAAIHATPGLASAGPYTVNQVGNRVIVTIPVAEKATAGKTNL